MISAVKGEALSSSVTSTSSAVVGAAGKAARSENPLSTLTELVERPVERTVDDILNELSMTSIDRYGQDRMNKLISEHSAGVARRQLGVATETINYIGIDSETGKRRYYGRPASIGTARKQDLVRDRERFEIPVNPLDCVFRLAINLSKFQGKLYDESAKLAKYSSHRDAPAQFIEVNSTCSIAQANLAGAKNLTAMTGSPPNYVPHLAKGFAVGGHMGYILPPLATCFFFYGICRLMIPSITGALRFLQELGGTEATDASSAETPHPQNSG